MGKTNLPMLAAFVLACLLAGALGSLFTSPSIPTWYASLSKPFFTPPSWLFAPVWTLLYVLMGISAYLIWEKGMKNRKARDALSLFALQLVLNILWSFLFFGLRSPLLGLLCILALLASIAACMRAFHPLDRRAAYLLAPYFAWVCFATVLNLALLLMN